MDKELEEVRDWLIAKEREQNTSPTGVEETP